eukprot:CAMPEP_0172432038 /NCGR_PEP_ID=MMETSP1064-20121228/61153_1 /TAXON_ID=202472 /ORGANISM="Aulacoseira subarctica , Strain CCAP 1002/5" /LENGTH=88 /DNA_ID=CAMNT_0013179079 /DNA_START=908 /DNA_END=1170 /DNA_ORIENTATION=-
MSFSTTPTDTHDNKHDNWAITHKLRLPELVALPRQKKRDPTAQHGFDALCPPVNNTVPPTEPPTPPEIMTADRCNTYTANKSGQLSFR